VYKTPRILIAVLIAFFVCLSLSVAAQSIFDSPSAPRQGAQGGQAAAPQAAPEAQQHFAKAMQLQKAGKIDGAIAELQIVKKLVPNQPAVFINIGLCYMQKQNLKSAESSFRQALVLDPKNAFATMQLARMLVTSGRTAEALVFAKKAARANPKDYNTQYMLGVVGLQSKNFAVASVAFKSALAIKPSDPGAIYNLGYCQMNMKKFADARKTFDRLLKIAPNDPQAQMLAGAASEQSGDKIDAISHYDKAAWKPSPASRPAMMNLVRLYSSLGKTDKAIATLKRAADLNKGDYEINVSLGRLLYSKNRNKDAEPYFLTAKKTRSDSFVNLNLAMNYLGLNKLKEAEACAQVALKMDPKNKQALDVYAFVMGRQQKTEEAVKAYRQLEQLTPKDPTTNIKIASLYQTQSKNELALAEYRKALTKKPKDAKLMASVAMCLKQAGKLDECIKMLKSATATDPKAEPVFMALADAYQQQKQPDLAIEQYKKILAFNPKSTSAMRQMAMVYDTKSDYKSEIETYQKMSKLDPKDTQSAMSIPRLYDKMGQLDTAITESKKLVDANPKDTPTRVQYAEFLAKKKDWPGALAQYAELIKSTDVSTKGYGYFLTGGVQESMEKPDEAIVSYKKCLEGTPSNRMALDALSKIYDTRKQQDEFCAYLRTLVETGKENGPYAYFQEAFKKAGKSDEATKVLEQLVQKKPDDAGISTALAQSYTDSGAKDKAIDLYKKMIAKDKNNVWTNRSLGDLYKSMDRNEEAASCYAEVVKAMPFDGNLQRQLGDLYIKLGKKTEALAAYKGALKYNLTDKEAQDAVQAIESGKPVEKTSEAPKPIEPAAGTTPAPAQK